MPSSGRWTLFPPLVPRVLAGVAAVLLLPAPAVPQQRLAPTEDGEIPPPGEVWFWAAPVLQTWHQEFGDDGKVPLAADLDGPLLGQVYPGPEAVLADLNDDAGALGFTPVAPDGAAVGALQAREVNVDVRVASFRLEAGLLDRLSADVTVPVIRTEVEPFLAFDPTGATLGGAATAVAEPVAFFGQISSARSNLQQMVESGALSPEEEAQAQSLLEMSGLFADAFQRRVEENALIPLAGTPAGAEVAAFYGQLQAGFQDFGLGLPGLTLPAEGEPAFLSDFFLGTLAADPPGAVQRGWLAGETEVGLKLALLRGFRGEPEGLQLRTTVGARARLPFRDPNTSAFIDPSDLLGLPLGDGQRDLEVSLYQDVRLNRLLLLNVTLRYGVQASDRLNVRVRSPERPLALPGQLRQVERDLGDYVRARVAPRLLLNPFLSVGAEYRLWHKEPDSYRIVGGEGDAGPLERETAQTRHRLGVGAFYRPVSADEEDASVPELGFVYQTALSGSGGETPAAGLVTFHVRVPMGVF